MKIVSTLIGLSMLGAVGAANAAEPMALTEAQMDVVTAGVVVTPFTTITITGTLSGAGLVANFNQLSGVIVTP